MWHLLTVNLDRSPSPDPPGRRNLGLVVSIVAHAALFGGLITLRHKIETEDLTPKAVEIQLIAAVPEAPPEPPAPTPQAVPEPPNPPEIEPEPPAPQKPVKPQKKLERPKPRSAPAQVAPVQEAARDVEAAPPQAAAPAEAPPSGQWEGRSCDPLACWDALLSSRLQQFTRYPPLARMRREQGIVRLHFTMDRTGKVLSVELEKSSGSSLLDDEALALIHRAEPLPPPPPEVPGERIDKTVPVKFVLQ